MSVTYLVKDRDSYLLELEVKIEPGWSGKVNPDLDARHPSAPESFSIPEITHDRREAARFVARNDAQALARFLRATDGEEGQWRVVRLRTRARSPQ